MQFFEAIFFLFIRENDQFNNMINLKTYPTTKNGQMLRNEPFLGRILTKCVGRLFHNYINAFASTTASYNKTLCMLFVSASFDLEHSQALF